MAADQSISANGYASKASVEKLRNQVSTLNNRLNNFDGRKGSKPNAYRVEITWGIWFLFSIIATGFKLLLYPGVGGIAEFGRTLLGALIITFLAFFATRLLLFVLSLLRGNPLSSTALLPSSVLGWAFTVVVLSFLAVGWTQWGPSGGTVSSALTGAWSSLMKFTPLGALQESLNKTPEEEEVSNASSEDTVPQPQPEDSFGNIANQFFTGLTSVYVYADGSSIQQFEVTPVGDNRVAADVTHLEGLAKKSRNHLLYGVIDEGNDAFNALFTGQYVKQNRIQRCLDKLPIPDPSTCNPFKPCLVGIRPDTGDAKSVVPLRAAL